MALARRFTLFAFVGAFLFAAQPRAAERVTDVRGVWVTSDRLAQPDASTRLISAALSGSFNSLFIPMALDERVSALEHTAVDALIRGARERGLRVHAWVQLTRASDADELPASRDHVIYRHPEWLMVPRELAAEMLPLGTRGPDYMGRLARWSRATGDRALYLSPLQAEAAAHVANGVKRIVERYALDGVHLDAVQFPGVDFDYSRQAMTAFRADMLPRMPAAERDRLDRIQAIDPFGYAEEFPAEWRRFRITRLTSLIARVRTAVKSAHPDAVVSAGVIPGAERALRDHLQDWRTWFDNGFVDALTRRGASSDALLFSYDSLLDPTPAAAATAAALGLSGSR
jgi:uncharacterized lipoprotein YddW (UPF0748 family)